MAYTALVTTGMAAAPPRNSLSTNAGLVLIHGPPGSATSHAFRSATVYVGRDPGRDVYLDASAVSRTHAAIEYRAGVWFVRDLGSSNGTFIDGLRVREAALDASSIVRFGDCVLRFVAAGVEGYARYTLDGERTASVEGGPCSSTTETGPCGYRIDQVHAVLRRLSQGRLGVVLAGEPGAEKERYARLLHRWRGRRGDFHPIDCAGHVGELASALLRGDLDGGTLLLQGADDLSPEDFADLRRSLEGRAEAGPETRGRGGPYRSRVYGRREGPLDVEVVVALKDACHPAAVLAVPGPAYVVPIPPLRERKEALYAHIRQILHELGRSEIGVGPCFMLGLAHHDFPGDVSELRSIVGFASRTCQLQLDVADLPSPLRAHIATLYRP
jgi:FHA domain/Sigma-54 interaction domain